ncbi:glycosyltransferase family 2 protein [Sulfurospirillum sp. 1612]|uniref:glycosyltransferase family 2 protein n=1 Tax=Sulfurospirillum sp. 1612 TaxID=3094835 RepID=UPI002F9226D4
MKPKLVSIVISLYNEEGNVHKLFEELYQVESALKSKVDFEYVCVNDGSDDHTLANLQALMGRYPNIKIYNLYRNFGHEIAMSAGMDHASGDCVIFMDGDLQHPPALIEEMVDAWLAGNPVVLTRKITHGSDKTPLYKFLSKIYYFMLDKLSDIKIPKDFPDFRLLDRKHIEMIKTISENDRMFRGLLNFVGYSDFKLLEFEVPDRFSGKTKYNFKRSFGLAIDSIMQFSTKPLRLATYLGVLSVFASGIFGFYTLIQYLFFNVERTGYATTLIVILFMGSIQLIILGIIGEYIGKIHLEVKKRPLYFGELIENHS